MKLAKLIGINVSKVHLHFVNNIPYSLISRYDRQIAANETV
ncbi:hypothetical protein Q652_00566 [Bartonella henselae JK 41]|nr:hypothetical protein Q653_00433 [Bartonella henselae JK 42]ETS14653.1 hypothetical protein Q652_00566 [Bartonella henselae JK 41]